MNLVALITDDELDLLVSEPEFVALALNQLGNAATPEDGGDALLAEAMLGVAGPAAAVEQLEPHLVEAETQAGVATEDTLVDDTAQFAADLQTGTQVLTDVTGLEAGSP